MPPSAWKRGLRGGAALVAWSGHFRPTSVRTAQAGQIGVSQVTQVIRVGWPWRWHVSPAGSAPSLAPSTAPKVSDLIRRRLSADLPG